VDQKSIRESLASLILLLIFEEKIPKIRDSKLSSPLVCHARSNSSLFAPVMRARPATDEKRKLAI
jgi:hypothetical protein